MKARWLILFFSLLLLAGSGVVWQKKIGKKTSSSDLEKNAVVTITHAPTITRAVTTTPSTSLSVAPLPGGSTVEDLSVAVTGFEKTNQPPHSSTQPDPKKDYVLLELIFRKIKHSGDLELVFYPELIDDHGNIYDSDNFIHSSNCSFSVIWSWIGTEGGTSKYWSGKQFKKAPVGLTWTVPVCPLEVPSAATLEKLKIYYVYRRAKRLKGEKELMAVNLSDFKPESIQDFYSQLEDEDLISLPYQGQEEEYFSWSMEKMKITNRQRDDLSAQPSELKVLQLPIKLKNTDYNPKKFDLGEVGIQWPDGTVTWGKYDKWTAPTGGASTAVPGRGEKTVTLEALFTGKDYEYIEGYPKNVGYPKEIKALLFYDFPGKKSDHFTVLPVNSDNLRDAHNEN